MPEYDANGRPRMRSVGAYQGIGKASEMGPPPKTPSGSVTPARKRTRKKKAS